MCIKTETEQYIQKLEAKLNAARNFLGTLKSKSVTTTKDIPNGGTVERVRDALESSGRPMAITEIRKKAGYSKQDYASVASALYNWPSLFRKVERGVYELVS